jgi:putative transposase
MDKTRDYIRNQEQHHKGKTFEDEFDLMISKYGFKRFADDEE